MTDDTAALPRYYSTSDLHPAEVQKRLKESAEAGQNRAHLQRLLVELLAQQVATRRYLLVLTTIAVLGFLTSVICGIVIAAE